MALHNVTRSGTLSLAGDECAPRPRRQHAPAKGQRVGDGSVRGCCCAQAGAPPPYVETSQKAPPCPATSSGACPGTTHETSCSFRSVSKGCISRRGVAAHPSAARNFTPPRPNPAACGRQTAPHAPQGRYHHGRRRRRRAWNADKNRPLRENTLNAPKDART